MPVLAGSVGQPDVTYVCVLPLVGFLLVVTVLCTHLHLDHCGWNTRREGDRWVPTFKNARYLFDQGELEFWQKKRDAGEAHMEHVDDAIQPIDSSSTCEGSPRTMAATNGPPAPPRI